VATLCFIKIGPVYTDGVTVCETVSGHSLDLSPITQIVLIASFELVEVSFE
jgi:hypothetical protein